MEKPLNFQPGTPHVHETLPPHSECLLITEAAASVPASSRITRHPAVLTTASYLVPELLDSPVVGAVVTVGTRALLLVPFPDLHLQVGVGLLQGPHFVQVVGQAVVEVLHRLLFTSRQDAIAASKASPKASPKASAKASAEAGVAAGVAAPVAASQPRDHAGRDAVAARGPVEAGGSVPSGPGVHGGKPAAASPQAAGALEGGGGGVLPDSGAHGEGWRAGGLGRGTRLGSAGSECSLPLPSSPL